MPPRPTRRSVLLGALGTAALLVTGCQEERPDNVVPTGDVDADDPRTWPADTQLLIAARQRVHGYLQSLDNVSLPPAARGLGQTWALQQERLEQLITLGGVPLPALLDAPAVSPSVDPVPTTDAPDDGGATTDTSDATASPRREASVLGRVLVEDLSDAVREASVSTPTNLAMLCSLAAQHGASAALLGAPVPWPPLAGPAGAAAVPVLSVTRPAVFGLEVVAARSSGEERAAYESVLQPLLVVTRQLETLAGETAPVPPLGYDLPEPLETAGQRRGLARALVADIAPATLSASVRVPGDAEQLGGVVRIVAETVAWSAALEEQAQPFPGMTLP
ncbi:hypothetical protein [Ornithinimicrobium sp. LYQ103]|uniref:hypothetical protein n=1 Tax=Ornithinimicrobium sp. LYQ103 TaxID=3378796 RepID=UPI0038533924